MSRRMGFAVAALLLTAAAVPTSSAATAIRSPDFARLPHPHAGIGQPAGSADISAWNIDVEPDGHSLPLGRGTVAQGAALYASTCASCHGADGEGGIGPRLVGGFGTLDTAHPVKTLGSYWPYATTVFDYIRRAMPFTHPQSLTNDQVYALVAYLLHRNGIVPADAVMDRSTLPAVKMPNRDGFIWSDPRPDVHDNACEEHCR